MRGTVSCVGRVVAATGAAGLRPQRRRPLPLRSVRNSANVAANSATATPSHSARLAST